MRHFTADAQTPVAALPGDDPAKQRRPNRPVRELGNLTIGFVGETGTLA